LEPFGDLTFYTSTIEELVIVHMMFMKLLIVSLCTLFPCTQSLRLAGILTKPEVIFKESAQKKNIKQVVSEIYNQQNPTSCEEAKILLGKGLHKAGFGSRMSYYRNCLREAMNKGLVYVETDEADHGLFERYVLPWSSCSAKDAGHESQICGHISMPGFSHPPDMYETEGALVWASAATTYLLRPTSQLEAAITEAKNDYGWNNSSPVAGIHIRHGDKGTEAKLLPLSVYVDHLRSRNASTTHSVFVATDDGGIPKEMRRYPEIHFQQSREAISGNPLFTKFG
jgi:hypothetical protein